MTLLHWIYKKWMAFALVFSEFMSGVILTIFFLVFVTPYALAIKYFSDPLHIKKPTGWQPKAETNRNLENTHHQY